MGARPHCASAIVDVRMIRSKTGIFKNEAVHLSFFRGQKLFDIYITSALDITDIAHRFTEKWGRGSSRWVLDDIIITLQKLKSGRAAEERPARLPGPSGEASRFMLTKHLSTTSIDLC
jgi:hypothetical protein